MKQSRIISRGLMFSAVAVLVFSSVALAGNPSSDITLEGPEYWGVIVADCINEVATLRVKKIEDCKVVTESKAYSPDSGFVCPDSEATVLSNPVLSNINIFGDTRQAVITKVKNHAGDQAFDANGDPVVDENGPVIGVYSMDVQIMFIKQ